MVYKIFQLNHSEEAHNYRFLPYRENRVAQRSMYNVVYEGVIEDTGDVFGVLESLFAKFNINHPADFKGHSLSVSDIIELDGKYYYCDSISFVQLKNW